MKPEARKSLSKMGMNTMEINAIEALPDLVNECQNILEKDDYSKRVNSLIRERYTISQELAILRQRDAKPEEFALYNEYVEWCKEEAKK